MDPKVLFVATLDRLYQIGEVFHVADQADANIGERFLTDAELWAIAYAHAPDIFVDANLERLLAGSEPAAKARYQDMVAEVHRSYHAGRNND